MYLAAVGGTYLGLTLLRFSAPYCKMAPSLENVDTNILYDVDFERALEIVASPSRKRKSNVDRPEGEKKQCCLMHSSKRALELLIEHLQRLVEVYSQEVLRLSAENEALRAREKNIVKTDQDVV